MDPKTRIEELAICGGPPAFVEKLHVNSPNVGDRSNFIRRVNDILDRKWLTNNGYYVQELEKAIAERLKVNHCIVVCNATVGLGIVARALGLKGEVIVPAFTFIATAHALQWLGIKPVFCDIDPTSHNIDPDLVEKLITSRTTGILGVHLWGRACDVVKLTDIAKRHDLKILFDAAHAFDCSYKGRMIGNFGYAEVFSFHATKFFNTLEGGAIVTNSNYLAKKIRLMKNFGFGGDVLSLGTNGKMNEISAAMGLTGLEMIDEFRAVNYRNYKHYQKELRDIPGIFLITFDETEQYNYQYIVLELDDTLMGLNRDCMMNILWAENVMARRYFYPPCHHVAPYRSSYHPVPYLPITEKLSTRVLVLPTGTVITIDHISIICSIIRTVVKTTPAIKKRLQSEGGY
jgi:dTDP-4-amino-4,6-dideoxygalactose transaminase